MKILRFRKRWKFHFQQYAVYGKLSSGQLCCIGIVQLINISGYDRSNMTLVAITDVQRFPIYHYSNDDIT